LRILVVYTTEVKMRLPFFCIETDRLDFSASWCAALVIREMNKPDHSGKILPA